MAGIIPANGKSIAARAAMDVYVATMDLHPAATGLPVAASADHNG